MRDFPMNLLGDLVAVRPEEEKVGKIVMPDWQKSLRGIIVAVGDSVQAVKTGERVVFGAAKGMESVFDGVALRVMREDDIDVVLE